MANEEQKRLLELQKEELKAVHGIDQGDATSKKRIPKNARSENNAKIAKLYEDAAEYEEELECFEKEFEVINDNALKDIPKAMNKEFPKEDGSYEKELKSILEAGWKNLVEVEETHPKEQLELIRETDFCDVAAKLNAAYPEYNGDFETDIKNVLIKRWEFLIDIKKEHIKDERAEMKLQGMKPDHIRKVYRNYHGLLD